MRVISPGTILSSVLSGREREGEASLLHPLTLPNAVGKADGVQRAETKRCRPLRGAKPRVADSSLL